MPCTALRVWVWREPGGRHWLENVRCGPAAVGGWQEPVQRRYGPGLALGGTLPVALPSVGCGAFVPTGRCLPLQCARSKLTNQPWFAFARHHMSAGGGQPPEAALAWTQIVWKASGLVASWLGSARKRNGVQEHAGGSSLAMCKEAASSGCWLRACRCSARLTSCALRLPLFFTFRAPPRWGAAWPTAPTAATWSASIRRAEKLRSSAQLWQPVPACCGSMLL